MKGWTAPPAIELPPRYYLDNFYALLEFVEAKYGQLLLASEREFLARFEALSEEARCLFLRLANRKGQCFRLSKLSYPEIGDLQPPLQELLQGGFCLRFCPEHRAELPLVVAVFTRQELCQLWKLLCPGVRGLSALKKEALADRLLQEVDHDELCQAIAASDTVVLQCYLQEYELLKFLFFGHLGGEMSEFVIRDLGLVQYESLALEKLVAKFSSRQEVDDKFWISSVYQQFRELREAPVAEVLYSWYGQQAHRGSQLGAEARPTFDRLTLKLARLLERQQQPHWALEVYRHSPQPPSRERQVRLLHKAGEQQQALELCHQMSTHPLNAEEAIFAQDYCQKLERKKAVRSTTQHLKEADTVHIPREYRYAVEKGVIRHFSEQGYEALFSENYLFQSLFGLLYWDIIFDQDVPVYHSPLQRFPSDLYLPQFLDRRQAQLQARSQVLSTSKRLLKQVRTTYDSKWGLGNPLVGWHENTLPLLEAACRRIPAAALHQVLLAMARNLKEYGRGFPDLFLWTKKEYRFVEVKSPTDALSPQQLYWLRFFKEAGIRAEVLRVAWV
ncbi:VRR-NUC domain-containing protein [Cesiribacter andamanensis]|uniref:phosphodiesterase I n=1 Tax=Cesiribacter andamanensis AMV16 TaxID=1279009 RepID=M7N511_9BACT|nr:VRR-NUC domain-containing protein [Cesiribacter andamanensis]EMR03728.1 VRR-NUC domain protein [Cesiribacter andamanensis AMV16]